MSKLRVVLLLTCVGCGGDRQPMKVDAPTQRQKIASSSKEELKAKTPNRAHKDKQKWKLPDQKWFVRFTGLLDMDNPIAKELKLTVSQKRTIAQIEREYWKLDSEYWEAASNALKKLTAEYVEGRESQSEALYEKKTRDQWQLRVKMWNLLSPQQQTRFGQLVVRIIGTKILTSPITANLFHLNADQQIEADTIESDHDLAAKRINSQHHDQKRAGDALRKLEKKTISKLVSLLRVEQRRHFKKMRGKNPSWEE